LRKIKLRARPPLVVEVTRVLGAAIGAEAVIGAEVVIGAAQWTEGGAVLFWASGPNYEVMIN